MLHAKRHLYDPCIQEGFVQVGQRGSRLPLFKLKQISSEIHYGTLHCSQAITPLLCAQSISHYMRPVRFGDKVTLSRLHSNTVHISIGEREGWRWGWGWGDGGKANMAARRLRDIGCTVRIGYCLMACFIPGNKNSTKQFNKAHSAAWQWLPGCMVCGNSQVTTSPVSTLHYMYTVITVRSSRVAAA